MLDLAHEMRNRGIVTTLATLSDEPVGFSAENLGIERIRLQGSTAFGRMTNLRSHLQTRRFDLVHTMLFASDITGRLAAWGTGIPVLSSIVNTTYDPERLADPHVSAWKVYDMGDYESLECVGHGSTVLEAMEDAVASTNRNYFNQPIHVRE